MEDGVEVEETEEYFFRRATLRNTILQVCVIMDAE